MDKALDFELLSRPSRSDREIEGSSPSADAGFFACCRVHNPPSSSVAAYAAEDAIFCACCRVHNPPASSVAAYAAEEASTRPSGGASRATRGTQLPPEANGGSVCDVQCVAQRATARPACGRPSASHRPGGGRGGVCNTPAPLPDAAPQVWRSQNLYLVFLKQGYAQL
jgi:hypothetical protein